MDETRTTGAREPGVIWDADFDPAVKTYFLWSTTIILTITIVGIPIAIVYHLIGRVLIGKYLESIGCALTTRTLEVRKGVLNKLESTIPLERITDLQMFQGPIMRHFGLRGFKVETAGQSAGPGGSLVNIIGIVDAAAFRKRVLDQRDTLASPHRRPDPHDEAPRIATPGEQTELLREIRDTLGRIETHMHRGEGPA